MLGMNSSQVLQGSEHVGRAETTRAKRLVKELVKCRFCCCYILDLQKAFPGAAH